MDLIEKQKVYKKCLSLMFPVFLLVFTVFCGMQQSLETSVLTEADMEKAFENVLCTMVCIRGNGHYGSGSIYEISQNEIIIVTNKHMLDYFDAQSYVTFWNGARCGGRIIGISETADIGFVSVSKEDMGRNEIKQLKCLRKREKVYDDLEKNDCFFMVDIASDWQDPVLYKGTVVDKELFLEEYGTEMLYGDGTAVPGMSGSGIFDYYGNYIGTLSGATQYYELAGVSLKTVMEEYKKIASRFSFFRSLEEFPIL